MKRKLWILFAIATWLALLLASTSLAETTGQCGDNVNYVFYPFSGTLEISETGPMWDFEGTTVTSLFSGEDVAKQIKVVVIENGVTEIGYGAFHGQAA